MVNRRRLWRQALHPEQRSAGHEGDRSGRQCNVDSIFDPLDEKQGRWAVQLSTLGLLEKIETKAYTNVELIPESMGHAGLRVGTTALPGCKTVTGSFSILKLDYDQPTNKVYLLVAKFEQRCDNNAGVLRGCVRWRYPP